MAEAAAATQEPKAHSNDVKIEDAGPARKRITITIPPEAIAEKLDESFETLHSESALPGFRKGRAPRKLIERKFGSAVRTETRNQLIADAYSEAIEENKIRPLGQPEPDEGMEDIEIEDGKPMTFSMEVEVVPAFDLPDFSAIEIKRPMVEVTDELIEQELQRQLRAFGDSEEIKGDFQSGDRLIGTADVYRNDEEEVFFHTDEGLIAYPDADSNGRGSVLGLLIDDLEKTLKKASVGDTLEFNTIGPDTHENEEVRGAKLRIVFTINTAERITPATVDHVVERFGMGTEDNLRQQVRMMLEQRVQNEQSQAMREQLYDVLDEKVQMELPENITAAQAARNIERYRMELLYRGMSVEEVEERLAEARADVDKQSQRQLKLNFILNRLAEEFDIEVTEYEVNGRIAQMASQRGERPAQLRAELERIGRLDMVRQQILEHKAADHAIARAKTIDISAEEWNKSREAASGTSKKKKKTSKKSTTRKKTTKKSSSKS